ncbi:MAG: type IV pilus assembly protein PilM [Verrucomicrobia bacterium]|nr:type IV pilus assembly protein PilM [Verrucomicrobiota bacterium]
MLASDRILALDIGASSVKIGEFHAGGRGLRLTNFNHAEIGLDPEHEEHRQELLMAAVRNLLREKGIRSGKVVFCVPGQSVFTRFVKLPPVEESKVLQIIQYEAQQNVPFPIEEVVWDYQLLGATEGGGLEVVLLAIKSDIIEEINTCVEGAGLQTEMVDVAPMALYNAYRYNEGEQEGCTLMVDIGARTTNLLFIENGRVFTRSIPIAGNAITQSIAAEFGKTFHEAEALKKQKGFVALGGAYEDPPDIEQAQVSKIIRNVMTRLHSEIARSINFYRTQQGGSAPNRALLNGGSSILPYCDRFFKEKLQIPVAYFNPFRSVTLGSGVSRDDLARCAHFLGEVVGLALRKMSECPIEVNLLPRSVQERKQARQKRPYLAGAAIGALLVPLCLMGFNQRATVLKQTQLAEVNREVKQLSKLKGNIIQEQQAADKLRKRIDNVATLVEDRTWWPTLLEDLNGRLVSNVWLVSITPSEHAVPTNLVTSVEEEITDPDPDDTPAPARPVSAVASNAPMAYLRLSGAGNHGDADLALVDDFRNQLRESPFLDKTDDIKMEVPPAMVREGIFTFVLRAKLARPIKY